MNTPPEESEKTTPKILPYGTYKTVICLSCIKEVEVELIPFGGKNAATCPLCGKLAYSGD